jgi:hypothetical protein
MPRSLLAVADALNAYAWTRGTLTDGPEHASRYCAVGALLRYAGVPRDRIANGTDVSLDSIFGPLLRAKYGISGAETLRGIMAANDGAQSQAEAIWRVLGVVSRAHAEGCEHGTQLPPAA